MFWILISLLVTAIVYYYLIKPMQYWKTKGVLQAPFFDTKDGALFKRFSFADLVNYHYTRFSNERFYGIYVFTKPYLLLKDPEIIKQITIKDFDHFTDHVSLLPEDYEPLWTRNLFALKGETWRDMRATLSPAFTSSKMRAMFSLMNDCAQEFTHHFYEKSKSETISDEMKDVFTRFTNDIIATCAFGVKCDSLKERKNEFYMMGKMATDFTGILQSLKFVLFSMCPNLSRMLNLKLFNKQVSNFFTRLVGETVKTRDAQNIVRPDMLNLLMEARKGRLNYEEDGKDIKETGFATVEESDIGKTVKKQRVGITDDDMTAQALIFFFAGFDSVATLMCFMAYELAINPDIQDQLREEVDQINDECNGKLTYEAINKMKYLDMIMSETLRKWPAAPAVDRVCVKPYTIERENDAPIQMNIGDNVWIPIWGIHHDEQYYENPEKFDPERFSDENKLKIKPYTYLPFGVGPRNCIGSRFALLETKTVFFHLLTKFEIVPVEKTPIPIVLTKKGFAMIPDKGFWLGFKPRK